MYIILNLKSPSSILLSPPLKDIAELYFYPFQINVLNYFIILPGLCICQPPTSVTLQLTLTNSVP